MNFETEKLTFRQKRILKSSKRRVLVDSIELGLASPEQIRKWSRRILPNKVLSGEVLTPKTVDYKTLKPIKDGLFCEKIFGPTRDFICSCGKKRTNKSFCPECDVEHTEARVRRYRLGHINLISPVTHVWYLRGRPSYISTFLGKKKRSLEALAYCTTFLPEFIHETNTSFLNSKFNQTKSNFGDFSKGNEIVFQARKDQKPETFLKPLSSSSLNPFSRFSVTPFYTSPFQQNWTGLSNLPRISSFSMHSFSIDSIGDENESDGKGIKGIDGKGKKESGVDRAVTPFGYAYMQGRDCKVFPAFLNGQTWRKGVTAKLDTWNSHTILQKKNSFSSNLHQGHLGTSKKSKEIEKFKNQQKKFYSKNIYRKTLLFGEQGFQSIKGQNWHTGQSSKDIGNINASSLKYFYLISPPGKKVSFKIYFRNKIEQNPKMSRYFQGRSPSRFCSLNPISGVVNFTKRNFQISQLKKSWKFAIPQPSSQEDFKKTGFLGGEIKKRLIGSDFINAKSIQRISTPFQRRLRGLDHLFSQNGSGSMDIHRKPLTPEGVTTFPFSFPFPTLQSVIPEGVTALHEHLEDSISEKEGGASLSSFAVSSSTQKEVEEELGTKNENIFFTKNFYSQCQTLPISPTFACDLDERSRFLDYITCLPGFQDRQISLYSGYAYMQSEAGMERKHSLEGVYGLKGAHLLTGEDGIEEILSYTGGEAIRRMINRFDMAKLRRFLTFEIESLSLEIVNLRRTSSKEEELRLLGKVIKKRARHWRRLKLAQIFSKSCKKPEWMILSALPVLPPDLRPILRLDGDVLVVSDLNQLYQKVLFRNSRFKRLGIVTVESVAYAKGLLQEAVDALLDNGKGGAAPMVAPNDRPLKSLSDILKGKRGRFRQNLLGKRVDYSGRSVIVVGPKLLLHQCGLPREMALELFQPFIIRKLLVQGFAKGIGIAKRMIQEADPIVWEILSQLIRQHPLLLNRAPTLHRLGIQAFQPLLVPGRAILLHPLVCTAFNADFDGDQMAVHIPLSAQARAESWKLLWSRNNILSPATGQPILLPSQDMVLGCYYLTQLLPQKKKGSISSFSILDGIDGIDGRDGKESDDCILDAYDGKGRNGKGKIKGRLSKPVSISHSQEKILIDEQIKNNKNEHPELDINKIFLNKRKKRWFGNMEEVKRYYDQGLVSIHERVWMRVEGHYENGKNSEKPIEFQVQLSGFWRKIAPRYQLHIDSDGKIVTTLIQTTPGRVLVNEIFQVKLNRFNEFKK